MRGWYVSCGSCGRKVEHHHSQPPCVVLRGWLTVSHWKGLESVDHYSFCCPRCLQEWVDSQVPRVPEVFLKSFGKEEERT
jgi:endogenous inhibitor of DNA gyrase (YacG/DUF329 family)